MQWYATVYHKSISILFKEQSHLPHVQRSSSTVGGMPKWMWIWNRSDSNHVTNTFILGLKTWELSVHSPYICYMIIKSIPCLGKDCKIESWEKIKFRNRFITGKYIFAWSGNGSFTARKLYSDNWLFTIFVFLPGGASHSQ